MISAEENFPCLPAVYLMVVIGGGRKMRIKNYIGIMAYRFDLHYVELVSQHPQKIVAGKIETGPKITKSHSNKWPKSPAMRKVQQPRACRSFKVLVTSASITSLWSGYRQLNRSFISGTFNWPSDNSQIKAAVGFKVCLDRAYLAHNSRFSPDHCMTRPALRTGLVLSKIFKRFRRSTSLY